MSGAESPGPDVVVVPAAHQATSSLGPAGRQRLVLAPGGEDGVSVTLGCSWFTARATSEPLRHDVDEFAYVVDGSGWIVDPSGAGRAFSPGDGVVIRAGEWHAVRAGDGPVTMVFCFGVDRPPVTDRWLSGASVTSHEVPTWWPPTAAECLDDLVAYRLVGASQCIDRIAEALVAVAAAVSGPTDVVLERVAEAGGRFATFKPDTALYSNVVAQITRPVAPSELGLDGAEIVAGRTAELGRQRRAELDAVEAHAVDMVDTGRAIVVHDYSSTVMGVARRLAEHRGPADFVVTAAEPLGAGPRVARELTNLGHRVTYCADASVNRLLPSAGCYLTGVETFYADGSLSNTVGTYSLALLCRESGIPVYAVTERLKGADTLLRPADLSATLLGPWPRTTVLPKGVTVERHVLDLVPARLVRAYVTQDGPLPPNLAASLLRPNGEPRG